MPHKPDVPCARCGKLLWSSTTSLPPGQRMCWPCRRTVAGYSSDQPVRLQGQKPRWVPLVVTCPCGQVFEQHAWGQKYCRIEHRPTYDPTRRPPRLSAAARGYDHEHRKQRAQAIAILVPGSPCPRCGEPMTADQALDLDHADDRQGYLGLSHTSCNRSAGATLGNQMRGGPWWQRTTRQLTLFPASKVKPPKVRPPRPYRGECSMPDCEDERSIGTDRCSQHLHRTLRVPKISKPCVICGVEFTTTARSLAKTCGARQCRLRLAGSHKAECRHEGCTRGADRAGRLCWRHDDDAAQGEQSAA